jgi:hypothetical protein
LGRALDGGALIERGDLELRMLAEDLYVARTGVAGPDSKSHSELGSGE